MLTDVVVVDDSNALNTFFCYDIIPDPDYKVGMMPRVLNIDASEELITYRRPCEWALDHI